MARTLVIGSNRGIGLEMVRQLAARGESVIATCRKVSGELKQIPDIEIHSGVDVADSASLSVLAKKIEKNSLDVLVIVAGVLQRVTLDAFDAELVRRELEVNALGPLAAAVALLPCMKRPSKIAFLTSRMGSIDDNTSGGYYGYRMSKAALNMAGKNLALDLKNRGIAVCLLHPGFVRTDMTGGAGDVDPKDSAARLIQRVDELTLETTGSFLHANGQPLPW